MNFKIVSKHSNMSHDGDLIRSSLYYTDADEELIQSILDTQKHLPISFNETVVRLSKVLDVLGFEMKEVGIDRVFDISSID